jgi:hypothetical protein
LEAGLMPGTQRRATLKVNNVYGIYRAVQSGLVEALLELRGPSYDAYFVYSEELRHSKRVAVFRDFLLS